MFWRYNALTSHIDTLLDNETVTLHELMDEDDILQECKGQNHKLIEFLVTPEVMEELVKLITCEPSEDVEDKVKYKYPNIACELLTSDVSQILDKLIEDNVLIDKIYAFMLSNDQLNPLLASFFTKVLGLLLVRKADYLFEYLTSKEDFLGHLLSHLGTSAIMDLLMRLVTYDPMYETKAKILKWMDEESMIEKMVDLISRENCDEMNSNAATALCDIVKFGREQLGNDVLHPDPLLDKIEGDELLNRLLDTMFDGGPPNESVITNGLLILQTILEYRRQITAFDDWRPLPEGCVEPLPQSELDRMDKAVTCVLTAVKPRIGEFAKLLISPPKQSHARITTTVGVLDPPLGNTRLQISRLFATLFSVDDTDLHICLIENDVVNKLLDLFFQYIWNNFLHTQIEVSINNILTSREYEESSQPLEQAQASSEKLTPTTVTQEEDTPLVTHLFKDCRIINRMVEAWQNNEEAVQSGSLRKGYMGHVTKICNDIVSATEKGRYSALIGALLDGLPDGMGQQWTELATTQLAEANKRNTSDLVGGHPLNSSSGSDSDSDFKDIPFPQDDSMQQAFSDYQMQQLTSTFIDQFGLGDEDFGQPSERIESAFNVQISTIEWTSNTTEKQPKAYEDVCEMDGDNSGDDDEEDMWKDKEITFNTSDSSKSFNASGPSNQPASFLAIGSDSDSSDDDELPSPTIIKSKPDISMEIDPATASTGVSAATVPIAMDTSPWETTATKAGGDDEEWTAFEGAENSNSNDSAGWADFSNLDNVAVSDGGPRVSSPDPLSDFQSPSKLSHSSDTDIAVPRAPAELGPSDSDSPTASAGQTPASSDVTKQSSADAGTPEAGLSTDEQQNEETVAVTASTAASTVETKPDAVSMEVDEPKGERQATDTTTPSTPSSSPSTSEPVTVPAKLMCETLPESSEIEITIPTSDATAGGDSPKSESSEMNGPQDSSPSACEEARQAVTQPNGPVPST